MSITEQTPRTSSLPASVPATLLALPAQRIAEGSEQTASRVGRKGWYVRALSGSTEALVRPAVDTLAALLLADALRRNGPGWTVTVRRYGGERVQPAA